MPKLSEGKMFIRVKKIKIHEPNVCRGYCVRNYLDWMTDLPWSTKSKINTDIKNAQKILDEDHYG